MSRFTAIDLSQLAPPDAIEALDFETVLEAMKADVVARLQADDAFDFDYDTLMLESEPGVKVLEADAYRELLLRARVNNAIRKVLLAKAQGTDLDHLGVYYGVDRQIVTEATETTPAVYESDASLRQRIQLAPEAFSTAGAKGAYLFHTLSADAAQIKAAGIMSPEPGEVHVFPLTYAGDGTPSPELLTKVRLRLAEDDIRPLTDVVQVRAPAITPYTIAVTLYVTLGPDPDLVQAQAEAALQTYADLRHFPGKIVNHSAIVAAAHVPGVERVIVASPAADIDPGLDGAAYATSVGVTALPLT